MDESKSPRRKVLVTLFSKEGKLGAGTLLIPAFDKEASETAVDAVESVLYDKALNGDIVAIIFYLKAHRPIYRDRLNINLEQVQSEIDEMMERLRENPGLLNPVSRMM